MITGSTLVSRLNELRKYTVTDDFSKKYVNNGDFYNDGVDLTNSNPNVQIVYYLGGIKYVDVIVATTTSVTSGTTYVIYEPEGTGNPNNFNYGHYYQNPYKENIVGKPKINDDVFIDRQKTSAFENNYRLEFIRNLKDLLTYAGGIYFNIVNNS